MEWSEVNLDAGEWLIPGHKMKGLTATKQDRPDHLVPLSQQAIAVLRELKPLTGRHRYAFPRHEEATDRCPTMPYSARYAAWTSAATK